MKVYVGNLSYNTSERDIEEFFSGCGGVVDVKLITDRDTGRAKGFGFVTFDSQEAADSAIKMSGQELDGRQLRIDQAQDKPKGGSGGGDRRW